MTAICITGLSPEAVQAAAQLLHAAGMEQARTAEHGRPMDIHQWHAQLLSRVGHEPAALQSPGRLWERLAADLLIANLQSPCWGWAEPLSVPLLGFWRAFEPQMRFVLVCETLEQVVARHIAEQRPAQELSAAITQWHQGHEAMLRFHLRHSQASQMVWATSLATQGAEHLAQWKAQWGLPLATGGKSHAASVPTVTTASPNALLAHLARRMLDEHPASQVLAEELAACIPSTEATPAFLARGAPDLASLVEGLQALRSQAADQAALGEQTRSQAQLARALEQARQQAQDEQAIRQQAFNQQLAEVNDASDRVLAQLHQAQEALEKDFYAAAQLKTEREKLVADKSALTKERDRESKTVQILRSERDKLANDLKKVEEAHKEAAAESELLLQQLHHVQEELERQFLGNQATQLKLQQLQGTASRVMASFPGAFDCESLELVSPGPSPSPWRWRAKGLGVAGHRLDTLEFETVIDQGVAGITLQRDRNQAGPLLRWPVSARNDNATTLIPVNSEKHGDRRLAILAQLSASDWDLTQALLQQMLQQFAQGRVAVPAAEQAAQLQAIARAKALMRPLQEVLRFNAVTLAGHQANEAREVLGLHFTHVSHQGQRIADFKLQFQAQPLATTASNELGGTVHLIFGRETALAPFEAWAANAKDGGKRPVMAISLSERGPRAAVWDRLSPADRAFVIALADALPLALALLHVQQTTLQRPWKDWLTLATYMRQWVRLGAASEPEPVKPAVTLIGNEAPAGARRQRRTALASAGEKPEHTTIAIAQAETDTQPAASRKRAAARKPRPTAKAAQASTRRTTRAKASR